MDARRLNSRKEARQTLFIRSCMERVWSILTPRYFTDVLKGISLPPMFAKSQSTRLRQDKMPTAVTSVLSVFNTSLLLLSKIRRLQYMSDGQSPQNSVCS